MKFIRGGMINMNKLFAFTILSLFVIGSFGGIVSANQGTSNQDDRLRTAEFPDDIEQVRDVPGEMEVPKIPLPGLAYREELVENPSFFGKLKEGFRNKAGKFMGKSLTENREYIENLDNEDRSQLRKKYEDSKEKIMSQRGPGGCTTSNSEDCPRVVGPVMASEVEIVQDENFLMENTREHVLSHIFLLMDNLQRTLENLEQTSANDNAVENIREHLASLELFAVKIKEASSVEELKKAIIEYKAWMGEKKQSLLAHQYRLNEGKFGNYIERARVMEEKLLNVIQGTFSEDGITSNDLLALYNEFSSFIDSAEESYNLAMATDNLDEAREHISEVRNYLRDAKEVLKNLLQELRSNEITVGDLKNA